MADLCPLLKFREVDSNGKPLAGGKLYSYKAGTTTPLSTYKDQAGATANTNPVILDASGRADVWLGSGAYKFILKDSNDVEIYSEDDVSSTTLSSTASASGWAEHSVTDGQSATNLTGETVDSSDYVAADYDFHVLRGTTVFASGKFTLQYLNSTWRIQLGEYRSDISHGVTWSLSGTTIAQLKAALDTGAGNGTIYLRRSLLAAS